MGRRKISIAPIADDRNRSVTFLKRKNGLFKKAYELGVLCSADVAVIVFNNAGKLFEFHSGDMDQILLRYSHYQGPPYEKRGPEDYASKDADEIAKRGLGGKMTTLDDVAAAAAADDDDEGDASDDSTETRPARGKGKGKAASGRQRMASESSPPAEPAGQGTDPNQSNSMGQPYGHAAFSTQPFTPYNAFAGMGMGQASQQQSQSMHQWPNTGNNPYGIPTSVPGAPARAATMPLNMLNPWMAGAAAGAQNMPQWAMQNLYSAAAAAAGQQGGPMGPNGMPSFPLPGQMGGGGLPDFGMLQQAYQQSQQTAAPPPPQASFFGLPMFGAQQQQMLQQQQQQQQQQRQQHQQQQHQPQAPPDQHQGQLVSSPQSSRISTPDQPAPSATGLEPSSTRRRGSPSRGNSLKPRLSVNIPGEGEGSSSSGNQQNGPAIHVTNTAQGDGHDDGQDDEHDDSNGTNGARAHHPMSARYASDLLPSPSGFLNEVVNGAPYSAGGLSGLSTAMAMSNDETRSIFHWPTAPGPDAAQSGSGEGGGGGGGEGGRGPVVTAMPSSGVRYERHETNGGGAESDDGEGDEGKHQDKTVEAQTARQGVKRANDAVENGGGDESGEDGEEEEDGGDEEYEETADAAPAGRAKRSRRG